MDISLFFKSIVDQDTTPVVICDAECNIVYMNPASVKRYRTNLTGQSLLDCHNADSNEKIKAVLSWFKESESNNSVYTYHNENENKDVYMVALRNSAGMLIGFYEKHEYRNAERCKLYDLT